MSTLFIICLAVVGAVVVLVSAAVIIAFVRSRRVTKAPPPPPFKCPACKSEQIEIFSAGLWDGEDSVGRSTFGDFTVGTCKVCGVHCEHFSVWDNDEKESHYETRALSEEEWQQETGPSEKWRRKVKSWPFDPEDENHVA